MPPQPPHTHGPQSPDSTDPGADTPANASDIGQLPNLLREDDRAVFGDAGYVHNSLKRAARKAGDWPPPPVDS